jgi:hypothetical protein
MIKRIFNWIASRRGTPRREYAEMKTVGYLVARMRSKGASGACFHWELASGEKLTVSIGIGEGAESLARISQAAIGNGIWEETL